MPLPDWYGVGVEGNTATTSVMYWTDASSSTTLPWQDFTTTTSGMMNQFIMSVEDIVREMRRFQGFRDNNLFWFQNIKSGAARKLSMLCLQAIREEQRAKVPRFKVKEHKMMFKPRATSCRKWTTGRPRK